LEGRKKLRWEGFDYNSPAWYFVTIISFQRIEMFGEIRKGVMHRSPLGELVADEWLRIHANLTFTCIDEFVVMPDHFHALIGVTSAGKIFHGKKDKSKLANAINFFKGI
jgi:putative transposase